MGANYALYKQVVPWALETAGINTGPVYHAAANLAVLSPLMFSGLGPVSSRAPGFFSRQTGKEALGFLRSSIRHPVRVFRKALLPFGDDMAKAAGGEVLSRNGIGTRAGKDGPAAKDIGIEILHDGLNPVNFSP